jgi:hypothetical protein
MNSILEKIKQTKISKMVKGEGKNLEPEASGMGGICKAKYAWISSYFLLFSSSTSLFIPSFKLCSHFNHLFLSPILNNLINGR